MKDAFKSKEEESIANIKSTILGLVYTTIPAIPVQFHMHIYIHL